MAGAGAYLALAGGVGGAKLADGLAAALPAERLTVAVNTGDDFEHLGLPISPDLDTVTYTLAGINNPQTGWGIAGETWSFMDALGRLGGPDWFKLGDRDLATHLTRAQALARGETLSEATAAICVALGITHRIVPMSDDPVRTFVDTAEGRLAFQDYFVRLACAPAVRGFDFPGQETAAPSPGLAAALADTALAAVLIGPSNPYVSIAPILGIPAVADWLESRHVPVIAVSPIVGGRAIKGPAAKMMAELGAQVDPMGIAEFYGARIDALVIDEADAALGRALRDDAGLAVCVAKTVMNTRTDRTALARTVLDFAGSLT